MANPNPIERRYQDGFYVWYRTDDNGKPILIHIENESKRIAGNQFMLDEIPDVNAKVFIEGYQEVGINQPIKNEFHYKVNYNTGFVRFHPSQDGQTVNINSYWGRGNFYISDKMIYTGINSEGVPETLSKLTDELVKLLDDLEPLLERSIVIAGEAFDIAEEAMDTADDAMDIANKSLNTHSTIVPTNNNGNIINIWQDSEGIKYHSLNSIHIDGHTYNIPNAPSQGVPVTNPQPDTAYVYFKIAGTGVNDLSVVANGTPLITSAEPNIKYVLICYFAQGGKIFANMTISTFNGSDWIFVQGGTAYVKDNPRFNGKDIQNNTVFEQSLSPELRNKINASEGADLVIFNDYGSGMGAGLQFTYTESTKLLSISNTGGIAVCANGVIYKNTDVVLPSPSTVTLSNSPTYLNIYLPNGSSITKPIMRIENVLTAGGILIAYFTQYGIWTRFPSHLSNGVAGVNPILPAHFMGSITEPVLIADNSISESKLDDAARTKLNKTFEAGIATPSEALAGSDNTKMMTPLQTASVVGASVSGRFLAISTSGTIVEIYTSAILPAAGRSMRAFLTSDVDISAGSYDSLKLLSAIQPPFNAPIPVSNPIDIIAGKHYEVILPATTPATWYMLPIDIDAPFNTGDFMAWNIASALGTQRTTEILNISLTGGSNKSVQITSPVGVNPPIPKVFCNNQIWNLNYTNSIILNEDNMWQHIYVKFDVIAQEAILVTDNTDPAGKYHLIFSAYLKAGSENAYYINHNAQWRLISGSPGQIIAPFERGSWT